MGVIQERLLKALLARVETRLGNRNRVVKHLTSYKSGVIPWCLKGWRWSGYRTSEEAREREREDKGEIM